MRYKGIIFDMDGVLIDSEPIILRAAMAALRECGVACKEEDFTPFIGAGEDLFIGGVAQKYGLEYTPLLKKRTYDIYDSILHDLKCFEGVVECLHSLRDKGLLTALASSADRRKINASLKSTGISAELFDVILSGEDVENKKPHPDIYLLAGEKLGLATHECMIVEDALNGITAAKAAKMTAIGFSTTFSEEKLLAAGADRVITHISQIVMAVS